MDYEKLFNEVLDSWASEITCLNCPLLKDCMGEFSTVGFTKIHDCREKLRGFIVNKTKS